MVEFHAKSDESQTKRNDIYFERYYVKQQIDCTPVAICMEAKNLFGRASATINILFIVIKLKSSRLQLDFFLTHDWACPAACRRAAVPGLRCRAVDARRQRAAIGCDGRHKSFPYGARRSWLHTGNTAYGQPAAGRSGRAGRAYALWASTQRRALTKASSHGVTSSPRRSAG